MANGITAEQAIDAARESKGFVTTIAKRLGCSRKHVYELMERFVTFKQAVIDERESLKDFAEGALLKQINEGNTTAIIFYLKCQAKERGYVERIESHTVNIDVAGLTNEQLERIAGGEDPLAVLGTTKSGG